MYKYGFNLMGIHVHIHIPGGGGYFVDWDKVYADSMLLLALVIFLPNYL